MMIVGRSNVLRGLLGVIFLFAGLVSVHAADHADTPLLSNIGRNDAKITDLFAFRQGGDLVLVLGTNPAIAADVTEYTFPTDVEYRIFIDNSSRVGFADEEHLELYGGTVIRPSRIRENVVLTVTFNADNEPLLNAKRIMRHKHVNMQKQDIMLFAGLRDDPFIVKPRIGKNVAAIVIQIPLRKVSRRKEGRFRPLLIWATSSVETINGNQLDLGARAFRSSFPENDLLNTMHPRFHYSQLGVEPDVIIYDPTLPVGYPNGRALEDDVATIIADPRILAIDDPSPTDNDVPFLADFPYLAGPQ